MGWTGTEILNRWGLAGHPGKGIAGKPVVLTGADSDRDTGQIAALKSQTSFSDNGQPAEVSVRYWRHMPFGDSRAQNLINIRLSPVKGKPTQVELDEIWVQSHLVFSRARGDNPLAPDMHKKINMVMEAVNRLNTHLRKGGKVRAAARIMNDCYLEQVTGEELVVRGLSAKEDKFTTMIDARFMKAASQGNGQVTSFTHVELDDLKTALGFRVNTLEPNKNFSGSREVSSADPQSGVGYRSGVRIKQTSGKVLVEMYVHPQDVPEGIDPKSIPDLLKFEFSKTGDRAYSITDAHFLGRKVSVDDRETILGMVGFAQRVNRDLAEWEYPQFMNYIYEQNLARFISPFAAPPSLEKEGGEFLYGSLHGTGFEKKIEQFGDQIGIAGLALHRGLKADGSLSTVGVAIDFPFASGGADSNVDGAVPDYLQYWDDIQAFFITHDHYDHKGGFVYYAQKGLLKEKTIYATDRVKYLLEKDMDTMTVPRSLRPKINVLRDTGATPIFDEDKNVRLWVQHCENAIKHSSLCTPYIITPCYNDDHYKGSITIYGDSRGLRDKGRAFFKAGPRALVDEAPKHGLQVSADKVDQDIFVAMHDVTAITYDGKSPDPREVESTQSVVLDWFADKGLIQAPISTNNEEYRIAVAQAHRTQRNLTAVGGNAEKRLAIMNLFGVDDEHDLRTIRIDPMDERDKGPEERVIPDDLLNDYFSLLADVDSHAVEGEEKEEADKRLAQAHKRNIKEFLERLPPDERDHEDNVRLYIKESLYKYGAVVFENDINGYLMYRAVMDRREKASLRATRTSATGKNFRDDPQKLMIMVTGTQGNAEEKQSTIQKLINFYSLLDADESVRPTGFKINVDDYVAVITQPAIVGNENAQERMISELVRNRNITVVGAFMNGFKIYNPKEHKARITRDLDKRGWRYDVDAQGSIRVYDHPIHVHGHGFKQDVIDMARDIGATLNEAHHIPSHDAYDIFRDTMAKKGLPHSGIQPDDFKFMKLDRQASNKADAFKCVAQVNPSYILVRRLLKYGQAHGGFVEWARTTLLRREGSNREDGLGARTDKDGVYSNSIAKHDWDIAINPDKRESNRYRMTGPGIGAVNTSRRPRSRARFSSALPHNDLEVA